MPGLFSCYNKSVMPLPQAVSVGLDEVGRGAWAGPLVAGAAVLRQPIAGVRDSKQLSGRQRESLAARISAEAVALGLGWVSAAEIDALGLTASVRLAFERALSALGVVPDRIIIDGSYNFFPGDPRAVAIIKADASVPAVSAASIVAKVARDRFMADAASSFPAYGFERHVGYGTAAHLAALRQHGVCALHRRSFRPVGDVLSGRAVGTAT